MSGDHVPAVNWGRLMAFIAVIAYAVLVGGWVTDLVDGWLGLDRSCWVAYYDADKCKTPISAVSVRR